MQKLTKLSLIIFLIVSSFFFAACGKDEETTTEPILVTSITMSVSEISILKNDTYTFESIVLPANAANKAVRYYVQNPSVASINETTGVLTAVNLGVTRVVVQTLDGSNKFATADVRVYNTPIQLTTPLNFALADNKLTWSEVPNALSYVVTIDNVAQTPTSLLEHSITGFNSLHTYKVQAIGDNYTILDSDFSQMITAKILSTPLNFKNTIDVLSWDEVTGAQSYEVYVNGAIINNELNTSITLDLSAPQTYEVKVRAIIEEENAYSSLYTESINITRLAVPANVVYQPGGIAWDTVAKSSNYIVNINGQEYETFMSNYNLPEDAEATSYTFKVKAVGDSEQILESEYSVEFTTTKLETPQNLRIQEGKIMWDPVSLAQTYSLELNGQAVQVGEVTELALLEEYLAGLFSIRVMADGNGSTYTNSSYSNVINATKLAASMEVRVVNGVVTWLSVPNATRYVVSFGNNQFTTSNTYFNADTLGAGEYEVKIRAEAENYLYSQFTAPKLVVKLATPENFRLENGLLRWNSVSYSSSYEVVAGSNSFNTGILNGYYLRLPGGNSYTVKVRSNGDNTKYLTSAYTESMSVMKLATPQNLTLENGYVQITPVENATSYVLEVNGVPYVMKADAFPYYLDETPLETYNIRLLARGNNDYLNSDYTETLVGYQLPAVQDVVIANSNISWTSIDGVTSYEVWIKGSETETYDKLTDVFISNTNSYNLTNIAGGKYNIKVRALGNNLSSLTGKDSIELYFEKLEVPTNYHLQYGMLLWNGVQNATKYLLEINNGTETVQEFVNSSLYALDESYEVGTYSIKIAAYGDGANYITSEWSTEITGDRMPQPQNVRVVDGAVEWDNVEGATIYVVVVAGIYFVGEGEDLVPRFEDADPYPAGDYDFVVYAASETTFASKKSTPINVKKLPYPTNLRVEDGIIKWDSILSGRGYRLVINDNPIITTELSYDFKDYPEYGPNDFEIKVMTLGDMGDGLGEKINSDYSVAIPLTIMESPNNLSVQNGLISWISVNGATDYELRVYEKVEDQYVLMTVDNPLLTGNVSEFLLGENYPAGEYAIDIRAIGDGSRYITSEFSSIINVTKLDSPTGLSLINGLITYNGVANSTRYEVLANDGFGDAGTYTTYELESYFIEGLYDISVRAIGDNTIYLTSNPCESISAEKLAPIQDFRVEDGVLKWSPNASASQYILNINYQDYLVGLVTSYELPNAFIQGNYTFKIKARGTSINLLNSNFTDPLEAYKMDVITNLHVEDGVISWNGVNAPDGYTVTILNTSTLVETKITLSGEATSYVLPSQFASGDYLIYVQTNGNSVSNLNSVKVGNIDNTSGFSVTKLGIPTDITLTETEGLYYLSWTQVPLAQNYRLVITKGGVTIVDEIIPSGQNYEVQGLETGEHLVSVQAIGDDVNLVNSDLRTPIVVTKPSMPTNLKIENGVVSWDPSTYATEYKLTINYEGVLQPVVTVTNTYYYLTNLGYYEVSVRAYYSGSLPSEETAVVPYTFNLFAAGNGSASTPFEVSTELELNNVKYNPTAYYILTNDISLSSTNFVPIGTLEKPFIGNFDGGYVTISGLTINGTYTYSGLFGYVGTNGIVKNITLSSVNITSSSQYIGAVAGYNLGTIQYITVSSTSNIKPSLNDASKALYTGGIVGYNIGTIEKVKNNATVLPTNTLNLVYAGGIAGYNNGLIKQSGSENTSNIKANFAGGVAGYNNGNIIECYNKGTVLAESKSGATSAAGYAGGIAGYNYNTDSVGGYTGLITNSYNWGNITATSNNANTAYAGGIAGYNNYQSATYYGEIKFTYNSGTISASNSYSGGASYAGGITGYNLQSSKLTYAYYLNTSAVQLTYGISGGSYTGSQTITYLKSSDFVNFFNTSYAVGSTIWNSVDSNSLAILTWELNY